MAENFVNEEEITTISDNNVVELASVAKVNETINDAIDSADQAASDDPSAKIKVINKSNDQAKQKIVALMSLYADYAQQAEVKIGPLDLLSATYAIGKGKILNAIYDEVSVNQKWGIFFEENFPNMKLRTANRWRLLASREDCYRHAALGAQRLLQLITLTKGMLKKNKDDKDPITTFLQAEGVNYDLADTVTLEIKNAIDAVINKPRGKEKKNIREFRLAVDNVVAKVAGIQEDLDSLNDSDVNLVKDALHKLETILKKAA